MSREVKTPRRAPQALPQDEPNKRETLADQGYVGKSLRYDTAEPMAGRPAGTVLDELRERLDREKERLVERLTLVEKAQRILEVDTRVGELNGLLDLIF